MPEFKNVIKKYGDDTVLQNFSLKLEKNSPIAIMGESGCGKTTLLRIAAGLEKPDLGEFETNGENLAYMFQEPRLLPWKNALDNVKAVLPKEKSYVAEKRLTATGLDLETDGKKFPSELSGGMKQRVALARFLAYAETTNATLLLLDEPFSALDDETATTMATLLGEFSKDKFLLFVTHDETDAKNLGAKIIRI